MSRKVRVPWTLPAATALVVGVLWVSAFLLHRSVQDASTLIARGMGEVFVMAGWEQLGGDAYPPGQELLDRFLEDHEANGLRFVGLVDDEGRISTHAGAEVGSGLFEGVSLFGDRARLVSRLRPRRPPGQPRPPPTESREELRKRLPRVVYEFEPTTANALKRQSQTLFAVAGLASLGVAGLAFALSRSLRQRESLRGELEHGRRLAALGSMSAVLAHEIRNPLASLKGHAQLLAESLEADPKLSPKVDLVVSEAVRLERLTNNLLEFVKTGELRRTEADPAQVLQAAAASVDGQRIEVQAAPGPAVSVDAERLRQALENVLRNAVQASGERVHAALQRENGAVVFTVRDHGPGIPAGEEQRIFEPFVTGRVKGVGLGLAIAKQIVELHGGSIRARNADGGGAEFELRVPAKEV